MYRVGESTIKRRHHRMVLYTFAIIAAVVAGVYLKHSLRADTVISAPPAAVTGTVSAEAVASQHFDESMFELNLPKDWKLISHQTQGFNMYTWQNTDTKVAGRILNIYTDTIPTTLGVNRAVLVKSNNNQLVPSGDVSDNCASFTSVTSGSPSTSSPAKWSGVDFLCDLGNYQRDVVGTVSADGLNRVALTGSISGQHQFFFTYTDNNIQPDFSIFLNALQSFKLK